MTWPSGAVQTFTDADAGHARAPHRGRPARGRAARRGQRGAGDRAGRAGTGAVRRTAAWLYEPFPAPPFSVPDVAGQTRSLAALAGKPALLLFWSATDAAGRAAVDALARGRDALDRAGVAALAIAMPAGADARGAGSGRRRGRCR